MKQTLTILFLILVAGTTAFSRDKKDQSFEPKYIKQVMIKAAKWQFEHPKHELWDWTNGAFYAGVSAAYKATGNKFYLNEMMKMGEKNQWNPGSRVLHADDHAIAQTFLDLYQIKKEQKMIEPFRRQMDEFLVTPYPKHGIEVITWWWCDALFMAPPALVKLSSITGDKKYMEKNDELFHETYNLLYDKVEHLFARDLGFVIKGKPTDKYEANGKKIFWSRGNGWVMGGLALMLGELPQDYVQRPFYETIFKEMAGRIASLQQEDGLWRASLLDPASYPGGEASGSGFFTFALAWGINNGFLSKEEYLPVVEKAWRGLSTLIQPDGHVGWCQPIGYDPRKDFSANSWEVYGTGAFLLAGSEVLKLTKTK